MKELKRFILILYSRKHNYVVDLRLESNTLWTTRNNEAKSELDPGIYYNRSEAEALIVDEDNKLYLPKLEDVMELVDKCNHTNLIFYEHQSKEHLILTPSGFVNKNGILEDRETCYFWIYESYYTYRVIPICIIEDESGSLNVNIISLRFSGENNKYPIRYLCTKQSKS